MDMENIPNTPDKPNFKWNTPLTLRIDNLFTGITYFLI